MQSAKTDLKKKVLITFSQYLSGYFQNDFGGQVGRDLLCRLLKLSPKLLPKSESKIYLFSYKVNRSTTYLYHNYLTQIESRRLT